MPTLEARIRTVLDQKSMLNHPFYQEWMRGSLEMDRLQEYARQYYHFELAFPRFLSAIHTRTESPTIRQLLLDNLWDEEHGERNHPALWLEFAEALGVPAAEVTNSTPNPETEAMIDYYYDRSRNAPIGEALATLFAYEGQVPDLAWQQIKALTEHYGFKPNQFEFFSVHLVADVAHAGAEIGAIEEASEDEETIGAAAGRACDYLLAFLDGCYAVAGVR
ncbi:MAG: CADD family putative folate metabolism protein [Dehalococcoidia bacterium]|nr:CADD family putative folate metabolism protein [Dehalococcoidia bacterium]